MSKTWALVGIGFVLISALTWALTRNRWWYRVDDFQLVIAGQTAGRLRTYRSDNGRLLVLGRGQSFVLDRSGSRFGYPQGGPWHSNALVSVGVHEDAMMVPVGKTDRKLIAAELQGSMFESGNIAIALPKGLFEK